MSVTVASGGGYLAFWTPHHEVAVYVFPREVRTFLGREAAVLPFQPSEARALAARLLVLADECEKRRSAPAERASLLVEEKA